jgi:putative FmdB family regulatory protein
LTYDFKCDKCSTEITVERSIHAEASSPSCLTCNQVMNRVYSVGAITFRGKGFYKTGG